MTNEHLEELTRQANRNLGCKKCWITPDDLLVLCELAASAMEWRAVQKLNEAVAFTEANFPLPRCIHGNALRDGAGEILEPTCGCRFTSGAALRESAREAPSELQPHSSVIHTDLKVRCNR